MWWLAALAGAFYFRGKIAAVLGPMLPDLPPQKTVFFGHLLVLIGSVLYILPLEFVGLQAVKAMAFRFSIWSTVLTLMLTIKTNYGLPPMPQNMSFSNFKEVAATTLQPWLQKAMMEGVDFHFLFFALIFLTAYPSVWALLILGRRSLWSVCSYASKNMAGNKLWLMFSPTWDKLKKRESEIQLYSAIAEITLGVWLAVSVLLPTRQLIATFLYWSFLRTRYQVPRSHGIHLQAWRRLEQQVSPVLKALPILNKPIDMAKAWFQPQYQQG